MKAYDEQGGIRVLATWPFVVSLAILLLNDLYLKDQFPGWLAGKLSDFSGVFLVSTIFFSMLPKHGTLVAIGLLSFYSFWKSPYSSGAIDYFNSFDILYYGRIVDYSDLMALSMVPFGWKLSKNYRSYSFGSNLARVARIPLLLLTVFAVTGTSVMTPHQEYTIRKADETDHLETEAALLAVREVALRHGLHCAKCKVGSATGIFEGNDMVLKYLVLESRGVEFQVIGEPGGIFFGNGSIDHMEELKTDLQAVLGSRFENMEFVIKLQSSQ